MRLFERIFTKGLNWNRGSSASFFWSPGAVPVRETDATQNSAVMACVFWAMRNAGRASFLIQRFDGAEWGRVDHPLGEIMWRPQGMIDARDRANLSGRELISALVFSRILDGNAFALKIRNAEGRMIGLEWLPHSCVRVVPVRDRPNLVDHYEILGSSGVARVGREDILHDRDGLDPERPCMGISRLKSVARQIATDNQIAAYSQSLLGNPVPSLIVSAKGDGVRLTQADADYVAERMRQATSRENAGGVVVPTFPAEVTPIGFKPDDLAIGQLNRLPEERITAVLGIPAVVVGLGAGLDRATYSNMGEARAAATEEFLIPLWQDLANTFTDQLLPEFGGGDDLRVWFES